MAADLVVDGGRRLISVVSPCYNEAEVIDLFYEELRRVIDGLPEYDFELILVDDGSADRTLEALNRIAERDRRVRVASFSRNFGHQIALTAGLDFAAGDAAPARCRSTVPPRDRSPSRSACRLYMLRVYSIGASDP